MQVHWSPSCLLHTWLITQPVAKLLNKDVWTSQHIYHLLFLGLAFWYNNRTLHNLPELIQCFLIVQHVMWNPCKCVTVRDRHFFSMQETPRELPVFL